MALLRNPFSLTPGFEGPKQPPGNKPEYDKDPETWTAPFVIATINTRNVHRSNFLMEFPYGKTFVYDEMMLAGPGEKGEPQQGLLLVPTQRWAVRAAQSPAKVEGRTRIRVL